MRYPSVESLAHIICRRLRVYPKGLRTGKIHIRIDRSEAQYDQTFFYERLWTMNEDRRNSSLSVIKVLAMYPESLPESSWKAMRKNSP